MKPWICSPCRKGHKYECDSLNCECKDCNPEGIVVDRIKNKSKDKKPKLLKFGLTQKKVRSIAKHMKRAGYPKGNIRTSIRWNYGT